MEQLASLLLHSRTQAHSFHIGVKGVGALSAHLALGNYYDTIGGLVDGLVEAYQGQFGIIQNYDSFPVMRYESKEQMIAYFEGLMGEINMCRDGLPSHLQNIVDTIIELITSTLYKIKFLG